MKITTTITNLKTGEVANIARSVTTIHPEWIHDQLGTKSEAELQHYLDGNHISDWYREGKHLGADVAGISMMEDGE